jgi:hypothetical protein
MVAIKMSSQNARRRASSQFFDFEVPQILRRFGRFGLFGRASSITTTFL